MKYIFLIIVLLSSILITDTAFAAYFTIVNHTQMDFYEVHVSPQGQEIWSGDLLRGHILKKGQSYSIYWNTGVRKKWDMESRDGGDNTLRWLGFDVTDTVKIVLAPHYARCLSTK